MNGLVPVMIAILFAEFGPRAALYADTRRITAPLLAVVAGIIATSVAGQLIDPTLTGWADAFLIAIALGFAAAGQAQQVKPATGALPIVIAFWRGGIPLITFAFATRFGAFSASAGALAGLLAAAALTRAAQSGMLPIVAIRWGAAVALAIAATVVAISALRLA